ncbi:MAG: DUF502 domain-containing protein [Hyphomonadaceae bacterium]
MESEPSGAAAPPRLRKRESVLRWISNNFAAGVALVLPFAVTFFVIWSFVSFVDSHVAPLLPAAWQRYAQAIPGAGVVIAVAGVTLLGALAANLLGRFVVRTGERVVARVPLVRTVYGGVKQVLGQVASPERTSFKEAVLVELTPGNWVIGFVTTDAPDAPIAALGPDIVAVYVPHAPLPTSGFLLYASRSRLRPLGLPPDEGLKRVISLGLIRQEAPDAARIKPR